MEVDKESLVSGYMDLDTDALLTLHQQGTLTDIAYSALEHVLTERGISPPDRPNQPVSLKNEDALKEYWAGRKTLKRTFWLPTWQ